MDIYLIIYIIALAVMSIITLILYAVDKKRAIKGQWRIKESVLLLFALCGGSLGAIIGMYKIRHKNRKWYFVAVNFGSLLVHIALAVCIALL